MEKLLAAGADPQALDFARLTPLHAAVSAGLPLDRMLPVITALAKACPALLEPSWTPPQPPPATAAAGRGHQGGGGGSAKGSLKPKGVRECIPKQNKKLRELIDKVPPLVPVGQRMQTAVCIFPHTQAWVTRITEGLFETTFIPVAKGR